jgi:hypothetical protein
MQLNDGRASFGGRLDLFCVGINEKRYANTLGCQPRTRLSHCIEVANDIQASLGSDFSTALGNQAHIFGLDTAGNIEHLFGDGRFKIHARGQAWAYGLKVGIFDVSSVFSQMQGNRISTCLLGQQCCLQRIRIFCTPCITQGGDVIDIDAEVNARGVGMKITHGMSVFFIRSELQQIDQDLSCIERHAT